MNGEHWWLTLDRAGFQAAWLLLSALWQSSILLAAAGALAWLLRRRRASVRQAVLAAAVLASPLIPLLGWAASRSGTPRAAIPVVPVYSAPVEPAAPLTPPAPAPDFVQPGPSPRSIRRRLNRPFSHRPRRSRPSRCCTAGGRWRCWATPPWPAG